MTHADVPPGEMQLFPMRPDPIDAALSGASDDPAVDALVRDLRSAYVPEGRVARSASLVAFTGEPGAVAATVVRAPVASAVAPTGRPRVGVAVAAFVASLSGKLLISGAVAAAAVGGLHATEVVDVPLLPDASRPDVPDVGDPWPITELLVPGAPVPAGVVDRPADERRTLPAPPRPEAVPAAPPAADPARSVAPAPANDVGRTPGDAGQDAPAAGPTPAPAAQNRDPAPATPAPAPRQAEPTPTPETSPRADQGAAPAGASPAPADRPAADAEPAPSGDAADAADQGSRPAP